MATMSSHDLPSSQVSQNDDFLSDASVGDLFSDLPDAFIEKLLDLERPSAETQSKEIYIEPIPVQEVATQESTSPIPSRAIHNTNGSDPDRSNENLSNIPDESLDIESSVDGLDLFELPNVVESPKLSQLLEEMEFDINRLDEEDASIRAILEKDQASDSDIPALSTESSPKTFSDIQIPRKISLRARTMLQLKPFTLEASKYKELIGHGSAKSKLYNVVNDNDNDDESDTDFTLSNTQAMDDLMDEISTYQDTQDILSNPSKTITQTNERADVRRNSTGKGKGRAIAIGDSKKEDAVDSSTNAASFSRPTAVINPNSNTTEHSPVERSTTPADDVFNFEKYGLNQLIIPPPRKSRDKGKSKIITFAKKRKGSRRSRSSSSSRIHSRLMEKLSNDIFDFDFSPKPNFNILQGESSASTGSPRVIIDATDDIDDPIEGYETPSESSQPNTPSSTTIFDATDVNMVEDDDEDIEEELPVFKRLRRKRKKVLLESDDDEVEEESLNTDTFQISDSPTFEMDDSDSIFDFPSEPATSSRSNARIITENEVVPIVEDAYEYRDIKRQRLGIKDLKKATLKNILPASFYKVNQRKIEEEERMREQKKREARAAKHAKKMSLLSTIGSASSSSARTPARVARDTEDVFAAFREDSEQSDDYEEHDEPDVSIETPGIDTDMNLMFMFDDIPEVDAASPPPVPIDLTNEENHNDVGSSRRPTAQIPENPLFTHVNLSNRNIPVNAEAIEDNRVTRHRNNDRHTRQPTPQSSIAIVKPNNTRVRNPNLIKIKQNPAPSKRKRRKLKRTRDDIHIHQPYYRSHRAGKMPSASMGGIQQNVENINHYQSEREINTGQNYRGMFINDKLPRRPFDDIYMNTKRQLWYKNDLIYIGNYDITDYLDQRPTQAKFERSKPTIYTLQHVTKQVEKLVDHELRRVIGLKDTVYWHHHLLQPLLSDTPNRKSAYEKFKGTYSTLVLFDQLYHWRHIHPRKGSLLIPLFARVFDDLQHMCADDALNKQKDLDGELPGHDHFYVFVSICLTQWVPLYPYESKLQLAEMFANQVRGLSKMVVKLVEGRPFETVPWRAVVKTLLFTLDWTCRLHHLGIDRQAWSVSECIKTLMDVLVYIGYDSIRNAAEARVYVVEAWVCILQILSVSDKYAGGYFFNEHIFITSLTDSINRKSRITELEFEKRKTTRLWAESLTLILTKHMMLL